MNFFTGIFHRFCLLFRNIYLKEQFWMAASVYFNREASQRSIHFLEKYYSREYLNVKITHSKQFRGGMCVGERERERGGGGLINGDWFNEFLCFRNSFLLERKKVFRYWMMEVSMSSKSNVTVLFIWQDESYLLNLKPIGT